MAQHHKTLEAEALERMELEKELEKGEIQMKVKQGHEYSQEEGSRLEMDLVDIKSDRYIVCMKVTNENADTTICQDLPCEDTKNITVDRHCPSLMKLLVMNYWVRLLQALDVLFIWR